MKRKEGENKGDRGEAKKQGAVRKTRVSLTKSSFIQGELQGHSLLQVAEMSALDTKSASPSI
jgi:hypothetical protein